MAVHGAIFSPSYKNRIPVVAKFQDLRAPVLHLWMRYRYSTDRSLEEVDFYAETGFTNLSLGHSTTPWFYLNFHLVTLSL
jgi:hypothetical protein